MEIRYTIRAEGELKKFPKQIADRILNKMQWFASQANPLVFSKRLTGLKQPLYRFEIGDYRVICKVEAGIVSILFVLAVRNRKDGYADL